MRGGECHEGQVEDPGRDTVTGGAHQEHAETAAAQRAGRPDRGVPAGWSRAQADGVHRGAGDAVESSAYAAASRDGGTSRGHIARSAANPAEEYEPVAERTRTTMAVTAML
jgi:hypothetical protein